MPTPAPNPSSEETRHEQERERLLTVLRGISEQETARLHSEQSPWTGWLDLAVRHGRYGFTNSLLINAQMPTATDVRSYQEWQSQGRQVRKGETGLRILSLRGNPRPVFDVSQTDDPKINDEQAHSPAQAWDRLHRLAAHLGFYVDRGERWTYTGPPGRLISIDPALDEMDAVTALAHQLGHVQLHGGRVDQADGERWDCHGVRRVEADSIAYILLAGLGVSTARLAFPPVRSWAGTDPRAHPLAAVRSAADRIARVTTRLGRQLATTPADVLSLESTAAPRSPEQAASPLAPANRSTPDAATETASLEELAAIHLAAHQLFTSLRSGSWVPAYLRERGFSESVQEQWQIGHAPKTWRVLTEHLRRLGHSDQAILASGLARRGPSGQLYDLFRDRAMMAIRQSDGTIVGFIGRLRPGAKGPKYLNSPQTPLFRKGELLYGLHEVQGQLASGARPVLVEGPLDAIAINLAAPSQYAALAPSGTALTTAQLDVLGSIANLNDTGLILALDGDQAGQAAMERAWNVLSKVIGPLEAVLLPQGQDPADILRSQGAPALRRSLDKAVPLVDVVLDAVTERVGRSLESPEDRMAAVRAAVAIIARLPHDQVAHQVVRLAQRIDIDPATITNALTAAITQTGTAKRLTDKDFPGPPVSSTHHTAPASRRRPRPPRRANRP